MDWYEEWLRAYVVKRFWQDVDQKRWRRMVREKKRQGLGEISEGVSDG